MFKEKTNLYILSIVGIVAVVGIVVLLLNTNIEQIPTQLSEENVVGFATSATACTDTDGGIRSFDYLTKGTISGGTWKTTGRTYTAKTDSCAPNGKLLEGFCSDSTHGFYIYKECSSVVGTGYVCDDGACVSESCDEDLQLGGSLVECAAHVSGTGTFLFAQDDDDAPIADMYLFLDVPPDEEYLAEGESTTDSGSGKTVTLNSIENDDYETLEFVAGSTSGEIRFTNNDGTSVEVPLAADSSYTSGEASDEQIFWGAEAPSSTTANQDELVYLEGETCQGSSSVVDCQGAMFLVIDVSQNAHLVQITNVDTVDKEINFDDMTYGTTDDNEAYTDGSVSDIGLTAVSGEDIQLLVDESEKSITFTAIGSSHGAEIETENGATLALVNTDVTTQTFEGMTFTEYDDGVISTYLTEFEISAAYDDATDNSIEFGLNSVSALGTSDGYGLFDFSDTDDNFQKFMTWKGTLLTYDRENQQSLEIEHPKGTVYAVVTIE